MKKIIVLFIAICCIMNLTTLNTDAKTKNITLQEVKKQVTQNKLPYALAKIGDPYKKFKGKKHARLPYYAKERGSSLNVYVYANNRYFKTKDTIFTYILKGKKKTNKATDKVRGMLLSTPQKFTKKQVTQTFGKPVEYKASKNEAGYIYFYNTNILVILSEYEKGKPYTRFLLIPFSEFSQGGIFESYLK